MNEKILMDCGLSLEQAKIYTHLLDSGFSSAKTISSKTGIGRALTYKIIDQLIALNLIEKRGDIGKITLFFPEHPRNIKDMVDKSKQSLNLAVSDFNAIFGALSSKYNLLSGKPNVRFLEGIDGLKEMYGDILEEGKDIRLIRSLLDHKDNMIAEILREHIKKQSTIGIKVKLIGPRREDIPMDELIKKDAERHVTRKTISENFFIPSQIIIYADKVAITDFKGEIVITIIENPAVRETFEKMFDYMFENIKETY